MKSIIALLFILMTGIANAQQWCIEYISEEYADYIFTSGDNSDEYEYIVGLREDNVTGERTAAAICVDKYGNYAENIFWQNGMRSKFTSVLGLGNGNAFVSALCSDVECDSDIYDKLWVAILDPNLEIVKETFIDVKNPYITYVGMTYTIRNNDDDIVLLTRVSDYESFNAENSFDYVFYKFDDSCNLLNQSYLYNDTHCSDITSFSLIPNTNGYAIFGNGMHVSGMSNVIYVDEDFKFMSMSFFDDMSDYPDLMLPVRMSVDHWCDEGSFLMSAQTNKTSGYNIWCPFVTKMSADMTVENYLSFERVDTTDYVFQYKSMAYLNPHKIYVATFWYKNNISNELNVYLINDKLELLGRKRIVTPDAFFGLHIHSTKDGGCVLVGKESLSEDDNPVIYKLGLDDFGVDVNTMELECYMEIDCGPNLVSSVLNINLNSVLNKNARIIIIDMLGRRYLDRDLFLNENLLTLDVSFLESGMYICSIIVDDKCILENKFVKN